MGKFLTKEHLAKYREKLEDGIAEYMAMPASERNANAVRAMLEGWLMIDAVEPKLCGCSGLTREAAEKWAAAMRNSDDSTGAHWAMEQTTALAENLGVELGEQLSPWCWWITVNMMYSDYYGVESQFGVATPEFFAALARAFLMDEDGPGAKEKLSAYYCGIVKPQF